MNEMLTEKIRNDFDRIALYDRERKTFAISLGIHFQADASLISRH
ncbi:hypothetical protein [Hydrococcus rivularis]|nr:hypothetical protein [Hydrococcus rivularis]